MASGIDFSTVTEAPGTMVSGEAMDMVLTRYAFAASRSAGRRVLEVACGPGPGLGYLAQRSARLVAGDYTANLLGQAAAHYGKRVPLVRLDATHLPFSDAAFDMVILFEAVYFLPDVPAFVRACHRILSPGGLILLATVNPEWNDFNPSPNATKYWSAAELASLLDTSGFRTEVFAGFAATDPSLRGRVMSTLKRIAVRCGLMPKTMKGKEFLKRFAFGKLSPFPAELTPETGAYQEPKRVVDFGETSDFKVLYSVAEKQ